MPAPRKVIITCAVTGAIHTPSMSKYLPVSPGEIAEAALGAAEAGAAIVHLHARDPHDGRPSQDPAHFVPILEELKRHTDAVVNLTTGGSPHMTVDERMRPAREFAPELASLNMGSMNLGLYPMLGRFTEFEHAWEREHLEKSRDLVFKNIRVNAISAGPVRTLAARSIAGFTTMQTMFEERAPLHRQIESEDCGAAAAYLLSDEAANVSGTTLYVDAGYHAMGM